VTISDTDITPTLLVVDLASRTGKLLKFLKGEKICYEMVYITLLCLGSVNLQESRWKVRIYNRRKTDLSERSLKGLRIIHTPFSMIFVFLLFIY